MIRHVAVFRFKEEFSAGERQSWVEMMRALPGHIPEIKNLSIGQDIVHGPSSWDIALIADFNSLEDLETYSTHPRHQPVLDVSGPVKEHLAVVDFRF